MNIRIDSIDAFIRDRWLYGVSFNQYSEDSMKEVKITFTGMELTLRKNEINALYEALNYLKEHPDDSIVFERGNDTFNPTFKMMRWVYNPSINKGGPEKL